MTFTYGLWSLRVQVSNGIIASWQSETALSFKNLDWLLISTSYIDGKYLEQLLDLLAITFWCKNPSIPFYGLFASDAPEIVKVYKKLSVVTTCMRKPWSFSSYTIKTKRSKRLKCLPKIFQVEVQLGSVLWNITVVESGEKLKKKMHNGQRMSRIISKYWPWLRQWHFLKCCLSHLGTFIMFLKGR